MEGENAVSNHKSVKELLSAYCEFLGSFLGASCSHTEEGSIRVFLVWLLIISSLKAFCAQYRAILHFGAIGYHFVFELKC